MIEMIDFQGKKWQVVGKCSGERIDDHTKLKENYGCDLVLKNNQNQFFMKIEKISLHFKHINAFAVEGLNKGLFRCQILTI